MPKKLLAILIALCMLTASLTSLSSCSKTTSRVLERVTNVFKSEFVTIPEDVNLQSNGMFVSNDRLYFLASRVINTETYESETLLWSYDLDGGDNKTEKIELGENEYINNFKISADGTRYFIKTSYDPETYEQTYNVICTGPDGAEKYNLPIDKSMFPVSEEGDMMYGGRGDYFYIGSMVVDKDNVIYISTDSAIIGIDSTGKVLGSLSVNTWSIYLNTDAEGRVFASYYDTQNGGNIVKYVNIAKSEFAEEMKLPKTNNNIDAGSLQFAPGYDAYYNTQIGIYGFNYADESSTLLLDWLNSDINPNSNNGFIVCSPDKMIYIGYNQITYKNELAFMTRVPEDEVTPKYLIELACLYYDWALPSYIVEFNRKSSDYRITLKDYSQYNTNDDYELGQNTLNADIAAGRIPDILILDSSMPVASYESKNMFVDLYTLMDAEDSTLKKEALLDVVKKPFERNGSLYRLISSYSIMTMAGKTSNVGGLEGWSISQMLDYVKTLPEDVELMQGMSQNFMMYFMFAAGTAEFIDRATGKCSFDSPEFINLLEYIKSLPAEYDYSKYEYTSEMEYYAPYRNDKVILANCYLYDFGSYMSLRSNFGFDEPLSFVGYPGSGGNGAIISANNAYAISSKSPVIDGAWDFLEYLFSDEILANDRYRNGLPITQAALDKKVEEEKAQYYYFYDDGGYSSSNTPFTEEQLSRYGDDRKGREARLTDEDIELVLSIINNATCIENYDAKLNELVTTETTAFFADSKTAAEAARIIQSSAQIYLTEGN